MYQIKEQVKTSEIDLNEMEISDLLDRKFKTRTTEAKRTVHKPNEISTKNIFKGTYREKIWKCRIRNETQKTL